MEKDITRNPLQNNGMTFTREGHSPPASKKELLSKMSHDIRTPLNVILGLANIL